MWVMTPADIVNNDVVLQRALKMHVSLCSLPGTYSATPAGMLHLCLYPVATRAKQEARAVLFWCHIHRQDR